MYTHHQYADDMQVLSQLPNIITHQPLVEILSTMAKKKNNKASLKKMLVGHEDALIAKQAICTEPPELNIAIEGIPTEEDTLDNAMEKVPTQEMPSEMSMSAFPAGSLTIVEPDYDVSVEDVTEELLTTCESLPKQPEAS
jgi:hypothetical protein